jgi:hypothetical protein
VGDLAVSVAEALPYGSRFGRVGVPTSRGAGSGVELPGGLVGLPWAMSRFAGPRRSLTDRASDVASARRDYRATWRGYPNLSRPQWGAATWRAGGATVGDVAVSVAEALPYGSRFGRGFGEARLLDCVARFVPTSRGRSGAGLPGGVGLFVRGVTIW